MASEDQDSAVLEAELQNAPQTQSEGAAAVPQSPTFWLSGGVIGCSCPECNGPMSVRLWLMAADCHSCGCGIVLTEEQEREARQLLESAQHAQIAQPVEVVEPEEPKPVEAKPIEAKPIQPPPQPKPQPAPPAEEKDDPGVLWLFACFEPAWIVSAVIHGILLIILGMILLDDDPNYPVKLTARISDTEAFTEFDQWEEHTEDTPFEDPSEFQVDVVTEQEKPVEVEQQPQEVPDEVLQAALPELEFNSVDEAIQAPNLMPGIRDLLDGRGDAARGKLVKAYGGNSASEAAVMRGLQWLKKVQERDGSWRLHEYGGSRTDTGGTGLGLLPFLGAGQTHREGQFKPTVEKALYWLIKDQNKRTGQFRSHGGGNMHMYAQAIATLALCEAYTLTRDPQLREPAQRAVNYIVKAQHRDGGWRYQPNTPGDTSVLGWQLMALRSAQIAYLKVPDETFDKVEPFLNSVQADKKGGRYGYKPGFGATAPMTAEGLLCRQYTGWPRDHEGMQDGVSWMLYFHPPDRDQPNIYYWYYATQVLHHYGGAEWHAWNPQMRNLLVDTQVKRGEMGGSWHPRGPHAHQGGRIYMTALALLTLEVYYRHLPLYDRKPAGDAN